MTMQDIREQLGRMEERGIALDARVEKIDKKLFNGGNGLISNLEKRCLKLERLYWMGLGGSAVAIWVFNIFIK